MTAPPPKPTLKPMARAGDGLKCDAGLFNDAPLVELEDAADITVAIENEIPECVAYDAVAYTEGAGALNKSSVTLQHAVFVRLIRSAWAGIAPLLQHHVSA
jgi:hypothetical protein